VQITPHHWHRPDLAFFQLHIKHHRRCSPVHLNGLSLNQVCGLRCDTAPCCCGTAREPTKPCTPNSHARYRHTWHRHATLVHHLHQACSSSAYTHALEPSGVVCWSFVAGSGVSHTEHHPAWHRRMRDWSRSCMSKSGADPYCHTYSPVDNSQ
jgi:hypothetical protein